MSLQDHLNQEAEFIASIVAEEGRKCAYCEKPAVYRADKALCDECSAHADEIIASGKDRNWAEYQHQVDNEKWGKGHCKNCTPDRRDDITKPDTTYSFPPATLTW